MNREKELEILLIKYMKEQPVTVIQWAILALGKELIEANADSMDLSQHCDIKEQRYKVAVNINISKL